MRKKLTQPSTYVGIAIGLAATYFSGGIITPDVGMQLLAALGLVAVDG